MIKFESYDAMFKMPKIDLHTKSLVSCVFMAFKVRGTSLRLSDEPRDEPNLVGLIANEYAWCLMRRGIEAKQTELALDFYLQSPPRFLPVPGEFARVCELMPG